MLFAGICFIALSAFVSQRFWRENGLHALQAVNEQRVQLVANAIKAEVSRQDHLPVVLSLDADVGNALAARNDPEQIRNLNQKLARVSVEAGVMEMLIAMKAGRFKVAKHLNDWWEEMRTYHRKEGKIVREHDDLISAVRYAWVMRRIAIVAPPPRPDVVARKPYDWRAG